MTTTVVQSCPKCGGDMIGEFRGTLANIFALKNTNVVICKKNNCKHSIDMNEFKRKLWSV